MLNLVLQNKLLSTSKQYKMNKRIKSSKHFPSSTREWKNSIYVFNKNNINLLPSTDSISLNIIKSYFSLFNIYIEKKLRTKNLLTRFRKLSLNKIFLSNGEFKHTNNKVIINLYLYNKQNNNYLVELDNIRVKLIDLNFKEIYKQRLDYLEKSLLDANTKKFFLIKKLKEKNNRINNYLDIYIENFCKKLINNEYKKRLLYIYYKQISHINESKSTYIYLQYLKEQLYKIYNKQIEFNLINLKHFYLNSDILSELLAKKIANNRKNALKYLVYYKNIIRVKKISSFLHKHKLNTALDEKKNATKSNNYLVNNVIKNIKYKDITGIRLEAKGRLTKRNTASRSLSKVKHKGNLLNIDSSLKGLSSILLKGNLRSNVQYTKLASKSRIGSFGLKGWIGGY